MNRFNVFWRFGYAIDYSKGRKEIRESALEITFGHKGRWKKLFWRFYWKTSNKGYLE